MKKFFAILLTGVLTLGLAACGGSEPAADADGITLKVGASPTPHAEILAVAAEELAAQGITLDIIEFTDYVQPNLALDGGDLDANYFQHLPYLEGFNESDGTDLVSIGTIHYEPMGIYAAGEIDLASVPEGAKVGIPVDPTNGGRALLLLEANGLIKLNPEAGIAATKLDVVENPLNLEIVDMEAAQLAKSLGDLDLAEAGYQVSMYSSSEDGEAVGNVRPVYSPECFSGQTCEDWVAQYRFGGGKGELTGQSPYDTDLTDSNAIDMITGQATMMISTEDEELKQNAWQFMKWWAKPETQVRFGREIEALLGSSARYATANRDAFSKLSWSLDDIEVLNEQWDWTRGIREVPGGYFTGRHISNAIRRVITNKEDSRETIIDYSITIDEEITKKRKEFGMPVDE